MQNVICEVLKDNDMTQSELYGKVMESGLIDQSNHHNSYHAFQRALSLN